MGSAPSPIQPLAKGGIGGLNATGVWWLRGAGGGKGEGVGRTVEGKLKLNRDLEFDFSAGNGLGT